MSYGSAVLEHDIRARAFALAEALALTSPRADRYQAACEHFREEVASVETPPDELTWYALERLAVEVGQPAVRWTEEPGPKVLPVGALVWISPDAPVPEVSSDEIRALRATSFVVAPASWASVLSQSGVQAYSATDTSLLGATKPKAPGR